jgi:serine/threonine-protein kinase
VATYEFGPLVGAGGMGEVYRGRDTRLNRDVAIKILLPAVAKDAERLARFRREAQVLASLNHPNIAHIHGLEEGERGPFLVMEFVDGPTLADRIAAGALPLDDAIAIARQVADALEAAHERGIVHRDLKPANIKVQDDGTVKILDFGLAKAMDQGSGIGDQGSGRDANSPTITTPAMTQAGLILGTAAYMSPEQAKGRPVDKRTDVWAFGCVFYEMLTARRAFHGEDVTDTIAAIVRGEPDWDALPGDTPRQIRLLLKRCLEKDRRARISDVGVARFLMNETLETPPPSAAPAPVGSGRRRLVPIAAGVLAGAALVAAAWTWSIRTPPPAPQTVRFTITPPAEQPLVLQTNDHDATIAPDGSFIVYRTIPPGMAIRGINDLEARYLASTAGARFPFVSADSQWVGFFVGGDLRKAAVSGGAAINVTRIRGVARGAGWADDGSIVFATTLTDGLMRVSADGGDPTALTTQDSTLQERHVLPHVLPGSRWVLFTVITGSEVANIQAARIDAVNLASGERKVVLRGGHDATYIDAGYLVYASTDIQPVFDVRLRGTLRAVRFDVDRAETSGESVSLIEQVQVAPTGAANYGVSRRGDLLYVPASATAGSAPARSLAWVDRKGAETPIPAPLRSYAVARISPDGGRIALDVRDQTNDIWIWDVARQTLTPLNRDPGQDLSPLWTPDGKRIVWTSTRGGGNPNLFWQAADGTGTAERLTNNPTNQFPTSITPDGRRVAWFGVGATSEVATDISIVDIPPEGAKGDAKSDVLISTRGLDFGGEISPDGKWLAYHSNESGEFQVLVRPFPNVQDGRLQISTAGGTRPAWARNGRELFYLDRDGLLTSVTVRVDGATLVAGAPTTILKTRYVAGASVLGLDLRAFDVSPDGQRFLMIKDLEAEPERARVLSHMVLVLNWVEELKSRLSAR